MVECKKRDRETLERLIFDNVALGSRILTDGWRAYSHLGIQTNSHYSRCVLPANEVMQVRQDTRGIMSIIQRSLYRKYFFVVNVLQTLSLYQVN